MARSDTAPRLETRAWLRTIGRRGPERWIWPVSAASWGVLIWGASGWYGLAQTASGHHHPGMAAPGSGAAPGAEFAGHLLMWAAMVGATMLPLIARNLRVLGLRSPRARRVRATLEVAAGWGLSWLAVGAVVSLALVAVSAAGVPAAVTIAVVCAAAVAWQFAPMRRVALARCHRSFAPPLAAAAAACLRFGRSLGRDSLAACGAGMVLMAVADHHLLAVAALAWLAWRDMRRPYDRPGTAVSVVVLVGVGLFAAFGQA